MLHLHALPIRFTLVWVWGVLWFGREPHLGFPKRERLPPPWALGFPRFRYRYSLKLTVPSPSHRGNGGKYERTSVQLSLPFVRHLNQVWGYQGRTAIARSHGRPR